MFPRGGARNGAASMLLVLFAELVLLAESVRASGGSCSAWVTLVMGACARLLAELPGALPGALPAVLPGALPAVLPGALPAVLAGTLLAALPGPLPGPLVPTLRAAPLLLLPARDGAGRLHSPPGTPAARKSTGGAGAAPGAEWCGSPGRSASGVGSGGTCAGAALRPWAHSGRSSAAVCGTGREADVWRVMLSLSEQWWRQWPGSALCCVCGGGGVGIWYTLPVVGRRGRAGRRGGASALGEAVDGAGAGGGGYGSRSARRGGGDTDAAPRGGAWPSPTCMETGGA